MQGAKSINPDFKIKVIWVNTWFDPGKEADAAKALIDQGVDVIDAAHRHDRADAGCCRTRHPRLRPGLRHDQGRPETQLTAIVDTWGPTTSSASGVPRRHLEVEQSWDGLKDGILKMAPYTNMPDDVKKMAEATEAKIKSGELHPFTGPINKQDGTEWLKAGASSDDGTLLGMNFYVEGVDDKLPK
jgi:basic membrane protein A